MKARSTATVQAGGRLGALRCAPPLTLRRVRAEPGSCGLCLVGTAAGPLPGDDLSLQLHLEPDAVARLTAAGASIAQGRAGGPPAAVELAARLADGAHLSADPGPLVVCAGSRVDVTVTIDLAPTASVEWRELVVLGRRMDDVPGAATIRWDVTRAGRPVLRQFVDLTDPALRRWATAGHRVLAAVLRTGPAVTARTAVHSRTAVIARVDARTELVTVLGDDAAQVNTIVDELVRPRRRAASPAVAD
ncbi:MAG TPA: urease accessory protein UreD [Jatrophihabitans sp.]|nr:urease accessory protein UreD [Jatrophihabitans sp.]